MLQSRVDTLDHAATIFNEFYRNVVNGTVELYCDTSKGAELPSLSGGSQGEGEWAIKT